MTDDLGYHASYAGLKCLSVSTGAQSDGAHEFLIHGLAGPGVERHIHGYAYLTDAGVVVSAGARLKNDVGTHVGEGIILQETTQEIARVTVTRTEGGLETHFSQQDGDEWLQTSASTHGGAIRRREVSLPCSNLGGGAEYSISMFDARTGVPADAVDCVVMPFSGSVPFGIVVETVRCF